MKSDRNALGSVYRCPVCGAELSVIKGGVGKLKPICCNTEMVLLKEINTVYFCSVCFSELILIKGSPENLQPICCNKKMKIRLH